jgi:hypothetical protein
MMSVRRMVFLTAIIYSMNGSLDSLINNNYNSTEAAVSPYIIDYVLNKDKSDYKLDTRLEWDNITKSVKK